jgi:hypothetical protein
MFFSGGVLAPFHHLKTSVVPFDFCRECPAKRPQFAEKAGAVVMRHLAADAFH